MISYQKDIHLYFLLKVKSLLQIFKLLMLLDWIFVYEIRSPFSFLVPFICVSFSHYFQCDLKLQISKFNSGLYILSLGQFAGIILNKYHTFYLQRQAPLIIFLLQFYLGNPCSLSLKFYDFSMYKFCTSFVIFFPFELHSFMVL